MPNELKPGYAFKCIIFDIKEAIQKKEEIYNDNMWGEHLNRGHWEYQKTSSDNNFCFLNTNRHCVKENNSYVQNFLENKSFNHQLTGNTLEVDMTTQHDNAKKGENLILDHITGRNASLTASKTVSPATCNNLYVNPPCFTVDKFVNIDQTNYRDDGQINQPNNESEISIASLEYKVPENKTKFLLINKNCIGNKVTDNFHTSLTHFETAFQPAMLNTSKQKINYYENDFFGSETLKKKKKTYSNIGIAQDSNLKNDLIQDQLLSIHQYNGERILKVDSKNLYRMTDLNTSNNTDRVKPNEIQSLQFQKILTVKPCATSAKIVTRERRKPNYRELINNAHALRSTISENDLNMQIIKRTLNYKQMPTHYFSTRNIAIQSFKRNSDYLFSKTDKNITFEKTHAQNFLIQNQDISSECKKHKHKIAFPLDLSLKTAKNQSCSEKEFPQKKSFDSNFFNAKNEEIINTSNAEHKNQNSVLGLNYNTSILSNSFKFSKDDLNSKLPSMDHTLDHNLILQAPIPEVKTNITKLNGIEKVSRKRPFPLDNFDDFKIDTKKDTQQTQFIVPDYNVNKLQINFAEKEIKPLTNLIEVKHDVSSNITRIRTKAELKGFVFQDECTYTRSKTSDVNNGLDLWDWKHTCEKLVDQLDQSSDLLLQNDEIDYKHKKCSNIRCLSPNPIKATQKLKVPTFGFPSEIDEQYKNKNLNENDMLVASVTNSVNALPVRDTESEDSYTLSKENFSKRVNKQCASNKKTDYVTRIVDLTKVSVVRLKREKCVSRILRQNEELMVKLNNIEKNENLENRSTKKKNKNFTIARLSNDTELVPDNSFARGKTENVNKVSETSAQNSNNIKTRLRTQVLKKKKKKIGLKRQHKNKTEYELTNSSEKIYLEVYKYKRALKIPPNLITIKSKCVHRISKSMTDLDFDQKKTVHTNEDSNNCYDPNIDNVPKSIIDVLHSRVVKSKHNRRFTQRYLKNERENASRSKVQQFTSPETKIQQFKVNENIDFQEKRNVFETQIIPSRTRMEHKMQINKEIIREVFKGRPSSATPQTDQSVKYIQKVSVDSDYDMQTKDYLQNVEHRHSNKTFNSKETKQQKRVNQNKTSKKSLGKNNRRIYKRRISSGFDYLRKRNKKCALYNYSRSRKRSSITEGSFPFKNESDILKEIQKCVLNKGVGQSVLHKAAKLGYIDVIVYCLEKMGLHPDHKDNAGYTPLHDACVNGRLDIAKVLLQYGANHSESAQSGIRPIHEASENGHIEIVRMLLSYGADPLIETYSGQTPLMLASDPKLNNLISLHLSDVHVGGTNRNTWSFQGPWNVIDEHQNGSYIFKDFYSKDCLNDVEKCLQKKHSFRRNIRCFQTNKRTSDGNELLTVCNETPSLKNICCDFEFLFDAAEAEGELFEFEESALPLPPLYLLKDEGMEKWVLLSDLCSLLKVKSKDTLLHKIFPSVSPTSVTRAFLIELKMCEFLEKATCLQLLCAGEKINICHSKVILIRYNESIRNLLGVQTVFMKL